MEYADVYNILSTVHYSSAFLMVLSHLCTTLILEGREDSKCVCQESGSLCLPKKPLVYVPYASEVLS